MINLKTTYEKFLWKNKCKLEMSSILRLFPLREKFVFVNLYMYPAGYNLYLVYRAALDECFCGVVKQYFKKKLYKSVSVRA